MFIPHADTVCLLNHLEHQERLRHAASQRIAAGARAGTPSPTVLRPANRLSISRLGGLLPRVVGTRTVRLPSPLASG